MIGDHTTIVNSAAVVLDRFDKVNSIHAQIKT
jgi:hypothetical protein